MGYITSFDNFADLVMSLLAKKIIKIGDPRNFLDIPYDTKS